MGGRSLKVYCAACHHVALLTPNALLRAGLSARAAAGFRVDLVAHLAAGQAMPPVRRLAAILAADVAGYSRLMGDDEEGTHERLKAHLGDAMETSTDWRQDSRRNH